MNYKFYLPLKIVLCCLGLQIINISAHAGPGESCAEAIAITEGSHTIPEHQTNSVWYSFTMPVTGTLTISTTDASYSIHKACNTTFSTGQGKTSFTSLTKDEVYFIKFNTANASFNWSMEITDYRPGDLCIVPQIAQEGTNFLAEHNTNVFWYSYTAIKDVKITVDVPMEGVSYYLHSVCNSYWGYGTGTTTFPGLVAGETYYIRFITYKNTFEWQLTFSDYEVGESCITASKNAKEGENLVPEHDTYEYWYEFTMPRAGKLNVMAEEYAILSTCDQQIDFEIHFNSRPAMKEGETCLIKFHTRNSFNWILQIDDFELGEDCTNPDKAIFGTNAMPLHVYNEYWYEFNVPESGGTVVVDDPSRLHKYYIISSCNDELAAEGSGTTSFPDLIPGALYKIKFIGDKEPFEWNLLQRDHLPAETCSLVIDAETGINSLPDHASDNFWYRFVLPREGKVLIDEATGKYSYELFSDCLTKIDQGVKNSVFSNLTSDKTYYLKFRTNQETFDWTFEMNLKETQTIEFVDIPDTEFSKGEIELVGNASSTLPVSFEIISGRADLQGNKLIFKEVGPLTIKAIQVGDNNFMPAVPVEKTFCVNPDKPFIIMLLQEETELVSEIDEGNQWFMNGHSIEGANSKTYTVTESGSYSLQIIVNGCRSEMSEAYDLTITSIEEKMNKQEAVTWPNPADDKIWVNFSSVQNPSKISTTLINTKGIILQKGELKAIGNDQWIVQFDTNLLMPGFYFILINDGNKLIKSKFIKK